VLNKDRGSIMIIKCPKCDEEFENIGKWSIKKFCSRKCANSRNFSEESIKKKIISALGKKYPNRKSVSDEDKAKRIASIRKKFENLPFENLGIDGKRKKVLKEQNNKCNRCDLDKWFDEKLTLELEHKDGDKKNNDRKNLEALCPNCHSLTKTWRGRNKQNTSVTDEHLINCLKSTLNIRQALIKADLSPRGGNYRRAKKLLENMGS
jgi:endogenous inhibitor of DNA gyrase (YacG/DUF329 family)